MNDVIKLLPDSVANQIAAGEVIQRPASVVKELVENAVDAGATSIEIIIKDAGRTLIQVVDNGKGMSDTDARMAFERHATSKITSAADLFSLTTMGFRGEALASIAAVAQIDLRTMSADASIGTRIIINGSKVESQEPHACTPGTNMMVKNLFYTVPARRKFLKKDSVEFANIVREFERLALVNPSLDFTLIHNDVPYHQLRRSSFKQRICELFGKNLDKQLIPVVTETSIVKINGFIGLPTNARKRNQLQYLLINGRNMRHPVFHKAILECYEELIPRDQQPNYFISFNVSPDTIDVNIHPTKNEIKFENEFAIRQILVAAVKESLGKFSAMPGIDFNTDDAPEIPAFNPDSRATGGIDLNLDSSYNPFNADNAAADPKPANGYVEVDVNLDRRRSTSAQRSSSARTINTDIPSLSGRDWEQLYEEFTRKRDSDDFNSHIQNATEQQPAHMNVDVTLPDSPLSPAPEQQISMNLESDPIASRRNAVQILNRYIVTPCSSGMMIIDQHRAHVRILYDRYVDLIRLNAVATQALLFPEVLTLSPSLSAILESMLDEVARLGFDISPIGNCSWNICGIPSVIENSNPTDILQRMLEETEAAGESNAIDESMVKVPALSMAKAVAVKNGTPLTQEETDYLLADLFKLSKPNYTPDGRTIIVILDRDNLSAHFNRN